MNKAQGRRQKAKAAKYARYKTQGRRITNRIRRLRRRIVSHPNDICASEALKRIKAGATEVHVD